MPELRQDDQIQRLERRLEEMAGLVQVVGKVNYSLELDDVLKISMEGFQRVLSSDFGCFILIQPDRRTLRLERPTALPPILLEKLQLLILDPKIEATVLGEQLDLFQSLGQRLRDLLSEVKIDRFALIPLTTHARPVGILLASIGTDKMLIPPSIDLLMSVGEQVGMAIEHARLLASVKESEEWHRAFIENSPDGFLQGEIGGAITFVNGAACEILEIPREEFIGKQPEEFVVDSHIGRADGEDLLREGVIIDRHIKIRTPKGMVKTLSVTSRLLCDDQGKAIGYQSIFRDVSKQQRLLETLGHRTQELTALNAIASTLSHSLESENVLDLVCQQIISITGMESVALYLADESQQILNLVAHRGVSNDLVNQVKQLGLDDPLTRRIAIEGQSLPVDDVAFYQEPGFAGPRAEGYHAGICVPIRMRGTPVGAIFVGSKIQTRYERSDVALMENISNQIGVALENADLYAKMQRRVRELDGLAQLSAACTSSLDLQTVLDLAVEWTQKLLHSDGVSIRLMQDANLYYGTARGSPQGVSVTEEVHIDEIVRAVIENRRFYVVNDSEQETWLPQEHRRLLQARSIRSSLTVPLIARDHVVGILGIGKRHPHRWSKNEMDLLQTIANQTANAIENAQLFQTVVSEQRKVQAIFDSGISGLFVTDAEGRIVMFNRAAERITGWTFAQVQGKKWVDLFGEMAAGVPVELVIDKALLRKQSAFDLEGRVIKTRDGRVIPVAKAAAPLLDDQDNVTGAVGAFWDLSREKAGELSREWFLRLVAHELRSPLTAVLSALQLLDRQGLSKEERTELWRVIRNDGMRLRKFADGFLDHEAAIKSPRPIQFVPLPIAAFVRKLVRQFKAENRKHRFRVRSCKPEPTVSVDLDRVENVLHNLLDNAVNYSPPGSLITVSIVSLDANTVEVAVQDQGEGIPHKDRERVFEPFYRLPKSADRRTYGHGFGLSIARSEIKELGGEIWVDGRKNRGAIFHITLRRAR